MGNLDPLHLISLIFIGFVPFLFSLCFHEMAHAWMAKKKGDSTGEVMGRLSMNPFVHADPVGTFILPLSSILFQAPLFFGWAKPVPVNERNLSKPREDMFWIAIAGPASNLLLAIIAAFVCAGASVFGGFQQGRRLKVLRVLPTAWCSLI
ncbi:MAG: site-2 protease family protein [Bdellovibrionota bacterium]